jgi:hypothetical protein
LVLAGAGLFVENVDGDEVEGVGRRGSEAEEDGSQAGELRTGVD